jgi:lipopolysaccharide biosynthesis protein
MVVKSHCTTDVCLFAHFDRDAIVDECVLHYLGKLKELSFSIIFISTSPLGGGEQAKLSGCCDDVILRPNVGLDFGSWSLGLSKYGQAINGRLLLANDSVYAPVGDLQHSFARLTAEPGDFYGIVESIDTSPHLQSWFLLFENHVVRSAVFQAIFAQRFEDMNKPEIIRRGEIGLTAALSEGGFKYRALYQPKRSGPVAQHYPFSAPCYLWRELIDDGIPFLKVSVVPDRLDSADLKRVVGARDPALARLIPAHQQRLRLPARSYRFGEVLLARFIQIDYWSHRHGRRAIEAVNFVLCALLLTLSRVKQRWFA